MAKEGEDEEGRGGRSRIVLCAEEAVGRICVWCPCVCRLENQKMLRLSLLIVRFGLCEMFQSFVML